MSDDVDKVFGGAFHGQRVLVTGHTGFKGAWLVEWLLALGADVHGLALPPPTTPALFDQLDLAGRLADAHHLGDIRDFATVSGLVARLRPAFIFHLAAQPLVRQSYREPVETYATNVMGTAHVLEAVRRAALPCVIVSVTTDKCYENRETPRPYNEDDPLGGHDPYSSSKGAAELIISACRRSFFSTPTSPVRLASVRAGNVIGGGDWAADRIVPDCMRALAAGAAIPVRNKNSTRPWQHVLEPLGGYLWLAARLAGDDGGPALRSAFNFGPEPESNRSVAGLVQEILKHWPGEWSDQSDPAAPHEAGLLNLSIDKAKHLLGWRPVWDFAATIGQTVAWYRAAGADHAAAGDLTRRQIAAYPAAAADRGQPWAGARTRVLAVAPAPTGTARMKIAVTGATGFIGRHLCKALADAGHTLTVLCRDDAHPALTWLAAQGVAPRVVKFDLADADDDIYARIGSPDVVAHLAWAGVGNVQSREHMAVELPRQLNFLSRLINSGLPRLLVTGSCSEYGLQEGAMRETRVGEPSTWYGLAKLSLLRALEFARVECPFELLWTRPFYTYGEGQNPGSIYPQLLRAIADGEPEFRMSAGGQIRDYLPVGEMARLLAALTASRHTGVVNVCSGRPVTVRAMVEQWLIGQRATIRLDAGYYPYRDFEPFAFWGDTARLNHCLQS
jgi:CDP-glucose 4,6-dehydratase